MFEKIVIKAMFLDISFYDRINRFCPFNFLNHGIGNITSFKRLYRVVSTRSETSDVENSGIAGADKM